MAMPKRQDEKGRTTKRDDDDDGPLHVASLQHEQGAAQISVRPFSDLFRQILGQRQPLLLLTTDLVENRDHLQIIIIRYVDFNFQNLLFKKISKIFF